MTIFLKRSRNPGPTGPGALIRWITFAFVGIVQAVFAATIQTDKIDYPPGQTAIITGSGWAPGEIVLLEVDHVGTGVYGEGHAPWTVVADAAGNVASTWYVNPDDSLGETFTLTASGQTSGLFASWVFTDSRTIDFVTLNGATSVTVAPGASITAVVTVTTVNGNGNQKWQSTRWTIASAPPAADTGTNVNHANHDTDGTFTETFTITAPTTPGAYNAYFVAYDNDAGTGGDSAIYSVPVTVVAPAAATTTSIASSANPSTYGQSVTFTATVSSSSTPTGGVSFVIDGNTVAGTVGATTPTTATWTYTTSALNAGTHTVSANFVHSGSFQDSSGALSGGQVVNKAPSVTTVTIVGGPFTYTGSPITPATVTVTGVGGLSLTPTASYVDNVDAGTATASYTYAGDANHTGSSDSQTFAIGKAASITTVTIVGGPFAYTGSPITPATVSVTGAGGLNLTPAASYVDNVNAGTATASYTYAGDANHTGSSDSQTFAIGKAASVTTVTIVGGPFTYTGSAITPATVSVSGVGGLSLTPTALYANNVNAGTATASYTFAGDANHLGSSDSQTFAIGKAASVTTVTIVGGPFTYTGSAIEPAAVSVTGVGGLNLAPAASYVNNVNAGTATASYTFAGDANHTGSSDSQTFAIGKASSVTTVTIVGGPFTYTGSAIEPATVSVTGAGGLNLTPAASYSNNVNAGTATASYTYAGDDNHNGSNDSKTFAISKASSTTVVTINGGPFTYTGSAIEPATVLVTGAGGLNLMPAASYSNNVNAGTATASYTYAGDDNHNGSSDSKTFVIQKASSTTVVTINGGSFTYTGSAIEPATVSVTGAGGLNLTPAASYANNVNAGTATASYTYAGDDNHNGSSDSKTFAIGKASSTTVVTINGGPFTYTGSAITPATVSVTGAGGLNQTPTANYVNNVAAGTATASYTYAGDDNHNGSSDSKTFAIGKASSTTVVTINGGPFTYTGSAIEPATVLVTGAGGLNLTPAASYANNVNAGTATASYTYVGDDNHNGSNDSKTFAIGKASSTTVVTINGGPFTYTGSAITPATVSVTGAGGLNQTPTANYVNNVAAGTATASYTFAGDANHTGSSDSRNFAIGKALLKITASDLNKECGTLLTFDMTSPSADFSVSGLQGSDTVTSVSLSSTGAAESAKSCPSPKYSITVGGATGTGLSNYEITYCTGTLTVVDTTPPVISKVESLAVFAANSPAAISATFSDSCSVATVTFKWDDGSSNTVLPVASNATTASSSHVYAAAGVYTVTVIVTDACGNSAEQEFRYIVVYDPNAGFVTGGGWINSPAGAYVANPSLMGKANFGFNAKYKKGQSVPTGETEFQFQVGNVNFHSTAYQWLVVAGAKAQYKGTGTLNGVAGYGFMLTATDGQLNGGGGVDKFRIKITNGTQTIYDNVVGASDDIDAANPQEIGGGSIVIQSK